MTTPSLPTPPGPIAMMVSRIILWLIWACLLMGAVSFVFVEALIFHDSSHVPTHADPRGMITLFFVDILVGVVAIGTAHAVRYFLLRFGKRRSGGALLAAYIVGKLITWFACDGAIFFSLILAILDDGFARFLPVAAFGWLAMAADVPLFLPLRRAPEGGFEVEVRADA